MTMSDYSPKHGSSVLEDHRHPRTIGWKSTTALAMGGTNISLFTIAALVAGQGEIPGQGSAAILLCIVGLLLAFAAVPGWLELVLMNPDRVGGISAACADAFRPYSPILTVIAGCCYWWGYVPVAGLSSLLLASVIQSWWWPSASPVLIASGLLISIGALSLGGVKRFAALAVPIAIASSLIAFAAMLIPILTGAVDWRQATDFELVMPFAGAFGSLTAVMSGLFLVGFAAPMFEAAFCHVGETRDPVRNLKRAVLVSAGMATVYFIFLPLVWLGTIGANGLTKELTIVLGPTLAPVLGSSAKAAVLGFMVLSMIHGIMSPFAGATRTLSQLADDGLVPKFMGLRLPNDTPWVSTIIMIALSLGFMLLSNPLWLIAAANFNYLIGLCLASVAVWLLRKNEPSAMRPYRAPRFTIGLGLGAATIWVLTIALGFQQFGFSTTVVGLLMAYSGAALYAWRLLEDRSQRGVPVFRQTIHFKLTGAMLLVLVLDAVGYAAAIHAVPGTNKALIAAMSDIFVIVAILTIVVGIVLPGMIAHAIETISEAATALARGTMQDFANAMDALGVGHLESAKVDVGFEPVRVRSRDEFRELADSFNLLQATVKAAALGLDHAREGIQASRSALLEGKEMAIHDAQHDRLTGLPNRTLFINRLDERLADSAAGAAHDWAVMFIDLDGFKVINDSLGHDAGDSLLIETASRFQSMLISDRNRGNYGSQNPKIDVVARFGGDEFTVLMKDCATSEAALALARRFHDILSRPYHIENREVHIGASMGISMLGNDYAASGDVLRDADIAMYAAKKLGRNRAEIYSPDMLALATKRLQVESDMRRALRDQEFVVHYQPIVSMKSQTIVGFEALVRWQPPGQATVQPSEFISIAEETGLIIPLGNWVLEQACEATSALERQFGPDRGLSMSVNLSPKEFSHLNLIGDVRRVLAKTGVNPALIILEITESCTMEDPERAVRVLSKLKALGLQLSVDDFGTGYSSLSYLQRFPVDVLKIDRSFVRRMSEDRDSLQIVRTILSLAQGLGLKAIAEGVETPEQLLALRRMKCAFAQGYLFSEGVTLNDATALIRATRSNSKNDLIRAA